MYEGEPGDVVIWGCGELRALALKSPRPQISTSSDSLDSAIHLSHLTAVKHIHRNPVGVEHTAEQLVERRVVRLEIVRRLDLDVAGKALGVVREEPPLRAFGP